MEATHWLWPTGGADYEAMTTAAQSKELRWNEMDEPFKDLFRDAAKAQWETWVENGAVRVLSVEESRAVRQELERKGETERILQPRFVLTSHR